MTAATTTVRGWLVCVLFLATGVARAGTAADYAHRWPLQAVGDSAAWQFELSPEVLEALQDPAHGDFEVFDATGTSMPVARHGLGPGRQWLQALFLGGSPADGAAGDAGVMSYRFQLPAVHDVDSARIQLAAGNAPLQVALQYRNGDGWTTAARVLASADPAADTPLPGRGTAREWRVQVGRVLTPAPSLQLGVRPPRYLFLARGTGPYLLAAGNTQLRRPVRSIAAEVAQLRANGGADWQPPVAALGARDSVPATVAAPAPPPSAWWRWLAGGGLLVVLALVAVAASRRRRPD